LIDVKNQVTQSNNNQLLVQKSQVRRLSAVNIGNVENIQNISPVKGKT
jgi:hypothetical protein